MLLDAFLTVSNAQDLTSASSKTASTNVVDLSVSRDIATAEVPVVVMFSVAPTSGTGGATLNVGVETSADNSTWTVLEETGAQPISGITANEPFAFRGFLNVGTLRYLRVFYTPSAALTAGTAYAFFASDFPRNKSYARGFVS